MYGPLKSFWKYSWFCHKQSKLHTALVTAYDKLTRLLITYEMVIDVPLFPFPIFIGNSWTEIHFLTTEFTFRDNQVQCKIYCMYYTHYSTTMISLEGHRNICGLAPYVAYRKRTSLWMYLLFFFKALFESPCLSKYHSPSELRKSSLLESVVYAMPFCVSGVLCLYFLSYFWVVKRLVCG